MNSSAFLTVYKSSYISFTKMINVFFAFQKKPTNFFGWSLTKTLKKFSSRLPLSHRKDSFSKKRLKQYPRQSFSKTHSVCDSWDQKLFVELDTRNSKD